MQGKISRICHRGEEDQHILQSSHNVLVITICNFDVYVNTTQLQFDALLEQA